MCQLCGVRQLCNDYWKEIASGTSGDPTRDDAWFDFEGTVASRNGSRSWLLARSSIPVLLLRTSGEEVAFAPGDRIRLLNLRREPDDESPLPVAILTQASETFLLKGQP
jgi:hypothetical protein